MLQSILSEAVIWLLPLMVWQSVSIDSPTVPRVLTSINTILKLCVLLEVNLS